MGKAGEGGERDTPPTPPSLCPRERVQVKHSLSLILGIREPWELEAKELAFVLSCREFLVTGCWGVGGCRAPRPFQLSVRVRQLQCNLLRVSGTSPKGQSLQKLGEGLEEICAILNFLACALSAF